MTEIERYVFDLNGYLVVPGALSGQEVNEINAVIDQVPAEITNAETLHAGGVLDWGDPIRKLVGHAAILPYMIELIGSTLRLDHEYALLAGSNPASAADSLSGGDSGEPVHLYQFRNGRFFCGLTSVVYALTDVPAGAGGFICVPRSHKSHVPTPPSLADISSMAEISTHVSLKSGDAVIFTHALRHKLLPWKTESGGEGRALLFQYCPGYMQCQKSRPSTYMQHEWNDHQKYLLEPASFGGRPPIHWPPMEEKKSGMAAD